MFYNILFGEKTISALAGFHAGHLSWAKWNLEMFFLCGGMEISIPNMTPGCN